MMVVFNKKFRKGTGKSDVGKSFLDKLSPNPLSSKERGQGGESKKHYLTKEI